MSEWRKWCLATAFLAFAWVAGWGQGAPAPPNPVPVPGGDVLPPLFNSFAPGVGASWMAKMQNPISSQISGIQDS